MTNLEQLLQSDSGKEQKEVLSFKFRQALSDVKRQLDLGCAPSEYQLLVKQHNAYEAALTVIENFQSNQQ